jgi:hypothetical protein
MLRVADGTLVPPLPVEGREDHGASYAFPRIPGVVYNGVHHTGDLFDFGPDFDKGFLSVLPPRLISTPYPVFVPQADVDGNDIAGIRPPEVAVPVATHTGWALRADGFDGCDAVGQEIAFARTKTERIANGDPRLSLEERYADHAAYVSAVARAAESLRADRLLLMRMSRPMSRLRMRRTCHNHTSLARFRNCPNVSKRTSWPTRSSARLWQLLARSAA